MPTNCGTPVSQLASKEEDLRTTAAVRPSFEISDRVQALEQLAGGSVAKGIFIWAIRGLLIGIALLVVAALLNTRRGLAQVSEESAVADAVNDLDHSLNELGATMEDRAAQRRDPPSG